MESKQTKLTKREIISRSVNLVRMMASMEPWVTGVDGHETLYGDIFELWPGDLCVETVARWRKHNKWRPSESDLYATAAEIASPLPFEGDAVAEILYLRDTRDATYARRDRDPNIRHGFVEGPPDDWSHPILDQMVRDFGGWRALREVEMSSSLKERLCESYQGRAAEWNHQVMDYLPFPPHVRRAKAPRLFPVWKLKEIPSNWNPSPIPRLRIVAARLMALPPGDEQKPPERIPCPWPEDIKRKFELLLGRTFPGAEEQEQLSPAPPTEESEP